MPLSPLWKEDTVFTEEAYNLLKDILKSSGELTGDAPYEKLVNTTFSKNVPNG